MVSVCAPVADSSATRSPGLAPRLTISGNSTGATAAMSAAFAPEMPETRYIAATSTYCRPPRTWPSRLARKPTIARAMPVISIKQTEEYEQRYRQQNEMAHALVHAANHDGRRRACRQRDVGKGRKPEGERDRDRRENHDRHEPDEEDQKVQIAERDQNWAQQIKRPGNDSDDATRSRPTSPVFERHQPQKGDQQHETEPDRQCRGPPKARNIERRRRNDGLVRRELDKRAQARGREKPMARRSRAHRRRRACPD